MIEILLVVVIVLLVAALALLALLLRRSGGKARLGELVRETEQAVQQTERALRDELARGRDEAGNRDKQLREELGTAARQSREELGTSLKTVGDSIRKQMTEIAGMQRSQLDVFARRLSELTNLNEQRLTSMRELVEKKLDDLRNAVDQRLRQIQEDNTKKLEQMRATVDEKLQGTLEKRLGESFKLVSERLEQVHKGLGEMQTLANGVGDLKRVLTNVKTRGTWGEIQLGSLLEQVLTPDQYDENVATKEGSRERVEFAIKLPGRDGTGGDVVWLPIDAKFPQEDYQRLLDAQERADAEAAETAAAALELRVKGSAKDIQGKYLDPPRTTDFGIMFLPTEGLYAEISRRVGLLETLQRDYRVVVAGPTTLAALLNSLQMGFQTLAIQQRSSEVWELLGRVKTEFGKFGDLLEGVHKKLQEASNKIEGAARKSRTIERTLRKVDALPASESPPLLADAPQRPSPADEQAPT